MRGRAVAAFALAAIASGCSSSASEPPYTTATVNGLELPARVQGAMLAAATEDGWEPRFWPGVNLGATIPGRQPGEVAPTRQDYDRWLDGIGELGARVVRVYTILRPAFYDALARLQPGHAGQAPVRDPRRLDPGGGVHREPGRLRARRHEGLRRRDRGRRRRRPR